MTTTDRDDVQRFQLATEAAEQYEAAFVPALFAEWAPLLVQVARVRPGQSVLDVACGTGIVARTVADLPGDRGRVTGIDLNEAMLAVARRVRPDLEWRQGDAGALPVADAGYDVALCQMALMFFPDRAAALREMARVVRPGGTVAVAVPAALDAQPAYRAFVEVAVRHVGPDARTLLGTYWSCGDLADLCALMDAAGLTVVDTWIHLGTAHFDSPAHLVATEIEASPLAAEVDAEGYARIREETERVLRPFTTATGALDAPLRGHLVAGRAG